MLLIHYIVYNRQILIYSNKHLSPTDLKNLSGISVCFMRSNSRYVTTSLSEVEFLHAFCFYQLFSAAFLAAIRVFFISIVTVIGPTPPGTGVM